MSYKIHVSNIQENEKSTNRQRRKSIGNDFMNEKIHASNNDNDDQPKIRKERSAGSIAENDKTSPSNTPRRRNSVSEFPSKSKKKSSDFSSKISDNHTHSKKLFKKRVSFSKPLIDPTPEIIYENPILWNDSYDENDDYHTNYSDSYITSNPIRMIRRNSKNGYINGKHGIWRKFVPCSNQIPACTLS